MNATARSRCPGLLVGLLSLCLLACAGTPQTSSESPATPPADATPAARPAEPIPVENVYCPVFPEVQVEPGYGVEYNGYWIEFCCDTCPDEFRADPGQFAEAIQAETDVDITRPANRKE